jgi:hypothetical protein
MSRFGHNRFRITKTLIKNKMVDIRLRSGFFFWNSNCSLISVCSFRITVGYYKPLWFSQTDCKFRHALNHNHTTIAKKHIIKPYKNDFWQILMYAIKQTKRGESKEITNTWESLQEVVAEKGHVGGD